MFDTTAFGSITIEEESSVEYIPVPEDDYMAVIDKYTVDTVNDSVIMKVSCKIDAPEVEDAHEKVVPYEIWLDITDAGHLDMKKGKNVRLGRLRAAIGQNVPGEPWSPDMIVGQPLRIKVKNRVDNNTGEIFSKAAACSAI